LSDSPDPATIPITPDASVRGVDLVEAGIDEDSDDLTEAVEFDNRRIQQAMLESRLANAAQMRDLRALIVKRGVLRVDVAFAIAIAGLALQLFVGRGFISPAWIAGTIIVLKLAIAASTPVRESRPVSE